MEQCARLGGLLARLRIARKVKQTDAALRSGLSRWCLSPLYDVLPRASHATERFLHLGIGPQGRLATLDNALEAHEMFTLSRDRSRLLRQLSRLPLRLSNT